MGRTGTKLAGFCLNRVATRVRARSPRFESKAKLGRVETRAEPTATSEKNSGNAVAKPKVTPGRRIMVAVDSVPETKVALHWALSHAVQSDDTVVLLDVAKPSKRGDLPQTKSNPRGCELLYAMKNMCQARRPEVKVEVCTVEGKERGPTIVKEAKKQGVSLLVLGKKKRRSVTWRLLLAWAGNRVGGRGSVAEYCIQNASCMALAVRSKSISGGGGYLITTKRHKDFWLLA